MIPDARKVRDSTEGPCWEFCRGTVMYPPSNVTARVSCTGSWDEHRAIAYATGTTEADRRRIRHAA